LLKNNKGIYTDLFDFLIDIGVNLERDNGKIYFENIMENKNAFFQ